MFVFVAQMATRSPMFNPAQPESASLPTEMNKIESRYLHIWPGRDIMDGLSEDLMNMGRSYQTPAAWPGLQYYDSRKATCHATCMCIACMACRKVPTYSLDEVGSKCQSLLIDVHAMQKGYAIIDYVSAYIGSQAT